MAMNWFVKMEGQISVRPVQLVKVDYLQRSPEYPSWKEPKWTFPFDFWAKFPEYLA